jgi:hypothetical protein
MGTARRATAPQKRGQVPSGSVQEVARRIGKPKRTAPSLAETAAAAGSPAVVSCSPGRVLLRGCGVSLFPIKP